MDFLSDVITYVRRIVKTPSNASLSDNLIIDYINRFWIMDVDARMQLFDLKTKYQFQTQPGVDQYNMPLYNIQLQPGGGGNEIASYPVYQGFISPAYINGIQVPLQTQKHSFLNIWPNIVQNNVVLATGDGSTTNFNLQIPILGNPAPINPPIQGILRGHVDISGIIAYINNGGTNIDPIITPKFVVDSSGNTVIPTTSTFPGVYFTTFDENGANMVVSDSGQFLKGAVNYGLLMIPGSAPLGNIGFNTAGYSMTLNTINYLTGAANVTFPSPPPAGVHIHSQCYYYQSGLPRGILYYNNTLTLRTVPDRQYLVELDAYLTPSAFLNTAGAIPFAYMAEYIARGAARKILSDTGDQEQFYFYEPLFKEQENLVWKRSQRQFQNNRTETIYSNGMHGGNHGNSFGGGAT